MISREKQKQHGPTQLVNAFGWDAQSAVPDLVINPYESYASDRSKHGALIGNIANRAVVVKPHENRARAQRELANMNELRKVGLPTVKPVGVFEGRNASYLITEKYEGLTALNGLRLRVAHNERRDREEVSTRVVRSAKAIAKLHANGITHGDFQAKNSFEGPEQEAVYLDLENTLIGSRGRGDIDRRAADVYMLGASLAYAGYLYNRSPSYRSGAITEMVIGPYADAVDPAMESRLDMVEAATQYTIRTHKVQPFGRFVNGVIKL